MAHKLNLFLFGLGLGGFIVLASAYTLNLTLPF